MEFTAEPAQAAGRDAIHQHSVPTGFPAREGPAFLNLPMGTCAQVALTCSGRPGVKTERAWASTALSRAVPPAVGPSTWALLEQVPGAPGWVVIWVCLLARQQGSPWLARCRPRFQLLPQPSPSTTAQDARDWGPTSASFQERVCIFKGWGFNYNVSALSRTECLPFPGPGVCV